jgi:hypothetical protein
MNEKTAVLSPIPRARERRIETVKRGLRLSVRML